MDIQEYRTSKLGARVTADIAGRWQSRVIAQGLADNRTGAISYLNRYGKSIGAPKVIKFAVHAEAMGKRKFAAVMWEKAFELETGTRETFRWPDDAEDVVLDQLPEALPDAFDDTLLTSFPEHWKPGKVATLQPQDIEGATTEHKWKKILQLTKDPSTWVQEKIDGASFKIGMDEEGRFFSESSYVGPFYNVGDFRKHGRFDLRGRRRWRNRDHVRRLYARLSQMNLNKYRS